MVFTGKERFGLKEEYLRRRLGLDKLEGTDKVYTGCS